MIALDFDGVVCDSVGESSLSAFKVGRFGGMTYHWLRLRARAAATAGLLHAWHLEMVIDGQLVLTRGRLVQLVFLDLHSCSTNFSALDPWLCSCMA